MTLQELEERVNVRRICTAQYKVTITYRGKEYTCKSNDTLAYDTLVSYWNGDRVGYFYRSEKQAYMAFYNECKRANGLVK
jgi:hypothetical protein